MVEILFSVTFVALFAVSLFLLGALPTAFVRQKFKTPDHLLSLTHLGIVGLLMWAFFWIFFLDHVTGDLVIRVLLILSTLGVGLAWKRDLLDLRSCLRSEHYYKPLLLSVLMAVFYLSLVHMKDVVDFWSFVADALIPGLPTDNRLQRILAERLFKGVAISPLEGEWLVSDRPPLQAGYDLVALSLVRIFGLGKQSIAVMEVLCQTSVVCSIWALLSAVDVSKQVRNFILLSIPLIGFVFINSIFTWPKLLGAGFAVSAVVCFIDFRRHQSHPYLLGIFSTLAMLSHGGVIFTLIPVLGWTVGLMLGGRNFGTLIKVFVTGALTYAPWIYFQKIIDPPGDRLLKWHLAGVVNITPRPFGDVFLSAYRDLGWTNWWESKVASFKFMIGPWVYGENYFSELFSANFRAIIKYEFFHPFFSLGLSFVGFIFLLSPRVKIKTQAVKDLWIVVAASLFTWWLLLWGGFTTSTHQGSYATMMLLISVLLDRVGQLPSKMRAVFFVVLAFWFIRLWCWNIRGTNVDFVLFPKLICASAFMGSYYLLFRHRRGTTSIITPRQPFFDQTI